MTALLLLAGCTEGAPTATESSTAPPVESPTPTPSPTPTETPVVDVTVKPERPAALDEPPSVDGAVAVAEYFLLLFPYVNATGDLREWSSLTHPECIFCASVVAGVEAKIAAQHHDEGGATTITSGSAAEVDPGSFYSAKVELVQASSATLDSTGSVVESFPGPSTYLVDMALVWENSTWRVREATPVEVAAR